MYPWKLFVSPNEWPRSPMKNCWELSSSAIYWSDFSLLVLLVKVPVPYIILGQYCVNYLAILGDIKFDVNQLITTVCNNVTFHPSNYVSSGHKKLCRYQRCVHLQYQHSAYGLWHQCNGNNKHLNSHRSEYMSGVWVSGQTRHCWLHFDILVATH